MHSHSNSVRHVAVITFAICLLSLTGCIPVHYWYRQTPKNAGADFIDAKTGGRIRKVLVIPMYESRTGLSTMIGEGPGNMRYDSWAANPFIYEDGKVFTLKKGRATGGATGVMVGFGWLWIGASHSIEKLVVIAPGFHGQWIKCPYGDALQASFQPEDLHESLQELIVLRAALLQLKKVGNPIMTKDDHGDFVPNGGVDVLFDPDEEELVATILDQWIAICSEAK